LYNNLNSCYSLTLNMCIYYFLLWLEGLTKLLRKASEKHKEDFEDQVVGLILDISLGDGV